ncbi:MAG: hypothetical protein DWQ07_04885 [Chloroflexi bacterium]|nr:MAG: hypothetical protein DWQ07_04885 [Chloroflexota bacterium]MBL1194767.1 hypothetical protein [Chloroflexota bacterium]NOH12059.1 hypothetical protein [Chloroflexota bacterium]
MTLIQILQIISALATVLIGLVAFFRADTIQGFTGLTFPAARGKVEMRSIFGGAFIALGAVPFFLGAPGFQALGIVYLGIGIARAIGTLVDRSMENSNLISLASEFVFGIILLL